MTEGKSGNGCIDMIKDGLAYVFKTVVESRIPPIEESAELVMKKFEERLHQIEKRILRKVSYLLILGFGGIFLSFALFFYLKEYLHWSNSLAYFSIGIIILITGLVLKAKENER